MVMVFCPACDSTNNVYPNLKSEENSCWNCKAELLTQPELQVLNQSNPEVVAQSLSSHLQNQVGKRKGFAIASLVLGIIGGSPWAYTASIAAIIFGHLALSRIKNKPDIYSGWGLAIAGLILGYLGLLIAIILGIMNAFLLAKIRNLGI